jgi:uncharacterized protein
MMGAAHGRWKSGLLKDAEDVSAWFQQGELPTSDKAPHPYNTTMDGLDMTPPERTITDAQCDRMETLLSRFQGSRAMNVEMLDGFFAALICCPDAVLPSEYLPQIWGGGEMADEEAWDSREQLQEFMDLVLQHWNTISRTLQAGDVYLPILLEDDQGVAHGNDWATGFMRGMSLRQYDWKELVNSEEHGGSLIPIFALANEHHVDPAMRPYKEPMDQQRREKLIAGMAAGLINIYHYFAPHRRAAAREARAGATYRRTTEKVGRNDPCPCGSGKKFKRCCGNNTLH